MRHMPSCKQFDDTSMLLGVLTACVPCADWLHRSQAYAAAGKALAFGRGTYRRWKQRAGDGTINKKKSAPSQQPALQQASHKQLAGSKRAGTPYTPAQQLQQPHSFTSPGISADPAAPPPSKAARNFNYGNSNSGMSWAMHVAAPGQEQSAGQVIKVTGVNYISKGATSNVGVFLFPSVVSMV